MRDINLLGLLSMTLTLHENSPARVCVCYQIRCKMTNRSYSSVMTRQS